MSAFRGVVRRNSATIAVVIVLVALGAILYVQAEATAKLQEQVEGQQHIIQQVKELSVQLNTRSNERTAQINQVNRHLDCIVAFFNQKDRTQKAIDNIETCTIKNTSTGAVTTPKSPSSGTTSTTPQKSSEVKTAPEISTSTEGVVKNTAPQIQTPSQPSIFNRVNDLINRAVGVQ